MEVEKLAAFQRRFAAALLAEPGSMAGDAIASQPGFAVYSNTVMRAAVDALAANFPTVLQLVGVEWFERAATDFVRSHLPRESSLAAYGEGFADVLESLAAADELPYLPGVARLDRAWTEAHLAADAPVLAAAALAGLSPEALLATALVPHPSARWLRFESLPAFTIWRRHREHLPVGDELVWQGESGLLVRHSGEVAWHAIASDAAAFLDACAEGLLFAAAVDRAGAGHDDSAATLGSWLPALVAAGAFTRLQGPTA